MEELQDLEENGEDEEDILKQNPIMEQAESDKVKDDIDMKMTGSCGNEQLGLDLAASKLALQNEEQYMEIPYNSDDTPREKRRWYDRFGRKQNGISIWKRIREKERQGDQTFKRKMFQHRNSIENLGMFGLLTPALTVVPAAEGVSYNLKQNVIFFKRCSTDHMRLKCI